MVINPAVTKKAAPVWASKQARHTSRIALLLRSKARRCPACQARTRALPSLIRWAVAHAPARRSPGSSERSGQRSASACHPSTPLPRPTALDTCCRIAEACHLRDCLVQYALSLASLGRAEEERHVPSRPLTGAQVLTMLAATPPRIAVLTADPLPAKLHTTLNPDEWFAQVGFSSTAVPIHACGAADGHRWAAIQSLASVKS